MPTMDGPTAIKAIRQLGYRGMIVGLTGNAMQSDRDMYVYAVPVAYIITSHHLYVCRMLRAGADDVFAKPLDVNPFWESVQRRKIVNQEQ